MAVADSRKVAVHVPSGSPQASASEFASWVPQISANSGTAAIRRTGLDFLGSRWAFISAFPRSAVVDYFPVLFGQSLRRFASLYGARSYLESKLSCFGVAIGLG